MLLFSIDSDMGDGNESNIVTFGGGRILNKFPLDAKKIDSRVVFTVFFTEHFS